MRTESQNEYIEEVHLYINSLKGRIKLKKNGVGWTTSKRKGRMEEVGGSFDNRFF